MSIIIKKLDKILKSFIITLCGLLVIIVFSQVMFRYFLKMPLDWSEGFSRLTFVWIVFIGAAVSYGNRNMICIEIITNMIPKKHKNLYNLILDLFSAIFIIFVYYAGGLLLPTVAGNLHPVLGVSWAVVFCVIPISTTIMVVYLINFLINDIKALKGGK